LHPAVVGEDADAHADVAGLRDPDHLLVDPGAGKIAGLLRARDVGHHRGRLAGQHFEHLFLDEARCHARCAEQGEGQQGLIGALQRGHPGPDCIQPGERVGDADR